MREAKARDGKHEILLYFGNMGTTLAFQIVY